MGLWSNMNVRIKKMDVMDIGLVKWSVLFFTIIIVKLFPQLLRINYSVLIVLVLVCGIRPLFKSWIKKQACPPYRGGQALSISTITNYADLSLIKADKMDKSSY